MQRRCARIVALALALAPVLMAATSLAHAVSAVNPFGVNVRSSGPSSVFLTFQSLDPGETAVEAFWCGELQPALMAANPTLQLPIPVQSSDPCLAGTVYGRLPIALDRSRPSRSAGVPNLTDIMTIPASVARRAYLDAAAGQNSAFFYVRRFVGPGGNRFVVVTCRMAGGGARVPLALMDVRLAFDVDGAAPTVLLTQRGQALPPVQARVLYNGNGLLRGRWELVRPGDPEPSEEDLLTEASLPVERRALQRRYQLVSRFEIALAPTGDVMLPGPDPARLPVDADGAYKLLLRIEASHDKEATSNTGAGRLAIAGGVAGFPMPVLRYIVGGSAGAVGAGATLLLPAANALLADATFAWADPPNAQLMRLEVESTAGPTPAPVLSALLKPGVGRYTAPPWFSAQQQGQSLRWRVLTLGNHGGVQGRSEWRALRLP